MAEAKSIPSSPPKGLTVQRLPNGGYVVTEAFPQPGDMRCQLFACSELGEALQWMQAVFVGRWPEMSA